MPLSVPSCPLFIGPHYLAILCKCDAAPAITPPPDARLRRECELVTLIKERCQSLQELTNVAAIQSQLRCVIPIVRTVDAQGACTAGSIMAPAECHENRRLLCDLLWTGIRCHLIAFNVVMHPTHLEGAPSEDVHQRVTCGERLRLFRFAMREATIPRFCSLFSV